MVRSFFLTGRDYFDRTLRQGLRFRRASKLWPYAVTSPRLGFQRRPTGFGPIISPSPALLVLRPVRSYRQALAKALAVASGSWCWRGSAAFIASTIFCSALSRHSAAVRRVTVLSLSVWSLASSGNRHFDPVHFPLSATLCALAATRAPPLKDPSLCAEYAQAGFCHEVRLRFDSVMPTGCAGGVAGGPTCVVRITLHVGLLL